MGKLKIRTERWSCGLRDLGAGSRVAFEGGCAQALMRTRACLRVCVCTRARVSGLGMGDEGALPSRSDRISLRAWQKRSVALAYLRSEHQAPVACSALGHGAHSLASIDAFTSARDF